MMADQVYHSKWRARNEKKACKVDLEFKSLGRSHVPFWIFTGLHIVGAQQMSTGM